MTKFVSIIGNGESRLGFDLTPLKSFSTVVGCNAQFRDYNFDYFVCADRHMCQEAVNAVGKNTTISVKGRHDPCVGIRAVPVAEAMMAITILDQLLEHESQIGKIE